MDFGQDSSRLTKRTDFRRPIFCLLGLPFDAISLSAAAQRVGAAVSSRSALFISTPNSNILFGSRRDPRFRDSVIRSDLSLADGMPLVWMAQMLGLPIHERVAGSNLFDALAAGAGGPMTVYFFGGQDGVAAIAHARLNAAGAAVRSVGFCSPGFGTVEDMSRDEILADINRADPDFVIVSLGAAKGNAWIERNRHALNALVVCHLGAVVNFVAGETRRAPPFMQRIGLEWLWRIKEEPTLWRRYFDDGLALVALLAGHVAPLMLHGFIARRRARRSPTVQVSRFAVDQTVIRLGGTWTVTDLDVLRETFENATSSPSRVELELSELGWVDSAFIGLLMLLHGHQSNNGLELLITRPNPSTRRLFALHCADFLLDGAAARSLVAPARETVVSP